jgi:hypothetical protein
MFTTSTQFSVDLRNEERPLAETAAAHLKGGEIVVALFVHGDESYPVLAQRFSRPEKW